MTKIPLKWKKIGSDGKVEINGEDNSTFTSESPTLKVNGDIISDNLINFSSRIAALENDNYFTNGTYTISNDIVVGGASWNGGKTIRCFIPLPKKISSTKVVTLSSTEIWCYGNGTGSEITPEEITVRDTFGTSYGINIRLYSDTPMATDNSSVSIWFENITITISDPE